MRKEKRSKTRDLLVDVARKLFAEHGRDNVTMNEIALVAGKGRRTVYTYFRNKDEVYLAVIENELNLLIDRLKKVIISSLSPARKLEEYIFVRFEAIKEAVSRNGSLRSDFFRNIYEVEKARRPIDVREIRMLKQIFDEGVAVGEFRLNNTPWVAMMFLYALKGLEAPYIKENIGNYIRSHRSQIMSIIFSGIKKHPDKTNY
ncbi:MAG TPA: TetR/AcrR family transcriptional regulator [Paludibacteraceae bacterium]|nr:TetR/AcrR family transcriptional regulator [Paludibacteraceae bacterium]HOS36714.1 TetR/AcrR family transcriptional regulator [Paludibacteraceae bacterium]